MICFRKEVLRGADGSLWRPTHIGNHVSIGSNATILPVRICDQVVIGAGSVVTRDITRPGFYAGNPARFLRGSGRRRRSNIDPSVEILFREECMTIQLVDLKKQYESIKSEIDAVMAEVLGRTAFIGGSYVKNFEEAFAAFCGVKHCVGVGNGTDALFIALKCLGIGPGDEVIVPANSFIATAEAVTQAGARVVFADIDPGTYNLDITSVAAKGHRRRRKHSSRSISTASPPTWIPSWHSPRSTA